MDQQPTTSAIPDFLVKTTMGCSVVVIFIMVPFTINNIVQQRTLLTVSTFLVTIACAINIWYGYHGRYSLAINSYFVVPAGFVTIVSSFIQLGQIGSYWPYLLVLSLYFVLPQIRARIANALLIAVITPFAWNILELSLAVRFTAVLFGTSMFALISMREIYSLQYLLKEQAITDSLTGLYNRTLLTDSLRQAIDQFRRTGTPMTLIMIDIDKFKSINDTLGHQSGDAVLAATGEILRNQTRGTDRVFRTGGEEFLVLAYNADEESSVAIAEKLRNKIADLDLVPGHTVTASIGVAGLRKNMTADAWIKAGDDKMYRAKSAGRNRVVA